MEMYAIMMVLGLITGLYLGKVGENRRLRKQNSRENYNWKGGNSNQQKKRAA